MDIKLNCGVVTSMMLLLFMVLLLCVDPLEGGVLILHTPNGTIHTETPYTGTAPTHQDIQGIVTMGGLVFGGIDVEGHVLYRVHDVWSQLRLNSWERIFQLEYLK